MKHKTFSFLLALLMSMVASVASAHDFEVDGIYYKITSSTEPYTVAVTYQGVYYYSYDNEYTGSVTIPESVYYNGNTYSVTSIGSSAFRDCYGLTSIEIPSSVTSIGKYAFDNCGLTSVEIPNSVTSIGDYAFYKCSGLTSIEIPNSVTSIGFWAFNGCSRLTAVHISDIGAWCNIFFNDNPLLYAHHLYLNGKELEGNLVIPNSVTSIGDDAFNGCTGLTSVVIPNSVTSIGEGAFFGCSGLTSVVIPNSVTSIGGFAFRGCTGLTSIEIPNSVTSIGGSAFSGCSGLTSVEIPNSVTSIGGSAFSGCSGLTSVEIPNSVTSIGEWAFNGCKGLTSVTIPESVTSIGDGAFSGCTGLTSIVVENGNTTYDSRNGCNAIIETASNTLIAVCKNTIIPNSVTSIGDDAFYGCSGLTSIVIPNSVTSIGDWAFIGCSGLTSIVIPNSVTSIGERAFSGCTGLTSIVIPNSVTSIGSSAFSGCWGLTSITINSNKLASNSFFSNFFPEDVPEYIIGNDVISIGANAFKGCTGLIKLTLGSRLQSIGSKAFADSGIRQLLVKSNTPPTAPLDVFSEQTLLRTTLYVPVGTVDDYAYANGWYKFNTIKESTLTESRVSNEYAYTLMNAKTFDYAVYDAVNDRVKMVGISNVDETNPKHCWQTVEMYGRRYLYNIGAKKFAVPGTGEAGLSISSDVSSISMWTGTDGIVLGDNTEQQWALVVDSKMDAYAGLAEDIMTGIDDLTPALSQGEGEQGIYDLSGRRVNVNANGNGNKKLKKGIYVVNGRKTVVR